MGRVERRRWMGLHGLAATGPNRTRMAGDADPHCLRIWTHTHLRWAMGTQEDCTVGLVCPHENGKHGADALNKQ
eukprot:2086699-Rhodomonas_salina.2